MVSEKRRIDDRPGAAARLKRGAAYTLLAALAAVVALMWSLMMPPAGAEAGPPQTIPACGNAEAPRGDVLPSAIPMQEPSPPLPAISATAAVVMDGETGRVLYDLHAHDRLPPASTTKIMTAILGLEYGRPDHVVVSDIDARNMIGSSVMGLRPGMSLTMQDLLYGLMLPSGNDAAVEIAKTVESSEAAFVDRMNEKAAALGLQDTHFVNPHGLDRPSHYSSAYDLARLARHGMADPAFAELVGTRRHRLAQGSGYELVNGNTLLGRYPGADGVKIGWTERAGWTLVASAVRDGRRLFVAVLHSQDRDADAAALFNWAWQSHRWVPLKPQADQTLLLARRLGFGASLVRALSVCG